MKKNEANLSSSNTATTIDLSPDSQDIRLVRIINTETLSGLSTLEIHFGHLVSNPTDLYMRIWLNSGNGLFSRQWVSLDGIYSVLSKAEKQFNAAALNPIGIGMSANNPSFVCAGLLAENLIQKTHAARSYELNDWTLWRSEMAKLIASNPVVTATPIPQKPKTRQRDKEETVQVSGSKKTKAGLVQAYAGVVE